MEPCSRPVYLSLRGRPRDGSQLSSPFRIRKPTFAPGRAAGVALAVLAHLALTLAPVAATQQGRPPLLYVEGGQIEEGARFTTPVIVVLQETTQLAGFLVDLRFDPATLEPLASGADPAWDHRFEPGPEAGTLRLSGSSAGTTCEARTRCPLFTVDWQALALGASTLTAGAATVTDVSGRTFEMSVVPGTLDVRGVTAGEISANQAQPTLGVDEESDGLGLSVGGLVLLLVTVGAGLAGVSGVAASLAKRTRPSAREGQGVPVAYAAGVEWPARPLVIGVERYLERVEQLGRTSDSRSLHDMDHHLAVSAALSDGPDAQATHSNDG